jgi:hypothetical protein
MNAMRQSCLSVILGITIAALAGCDSITTPSSDLLTDNYQDTQQTESNGTTPPESESSDTATAQEKAKAVQSVIDAAEAIAMSVASILPVKDLQVFFEGGLTLPGCPTIVTEPDSNTILLALDYGDGCSPGLHHESTFTGLVSGTAFIAFNAFEFSYDEFQIDGASLDGTISGSHLPLDDATEFIISIDLALADGTLVEGNATVDVETTTGVITIVEATARVVMTIGDIVDAAMVGLLVDLATYGSFVPSAGTVDMDLRDDREASETVSISFEFTPQTPVDRTVTLTTQP